MQRLLASMLCSHALLIQVTIAGLVDHELQRSVSNGIFILETCVQINAKYPMKYGNVG